MQEEKMILEGQEKEKYLRNSIMKKDHYGESIHALIQYMEVHEQNPSEKRWNQYAITKQYLSSKTIGYISQIGFNTLCRKLRKEINKKKRQP